MMPFLRRGEIQRTMGDQITPQVSNIAENISSRFSGPPLSRRTMITDCRRRATRRGPVRRRAPEGDKEGHRGGNRRRASELRGHGAACRRREAPTRCRTTGVATR